jgi:hypothetical protein
MGGLEESDAHKHEDLQHVKGQEGRVEAKVSGWDRLEGIVTRTSEEPHKAKAEQMAHVENGYRTVAKLFGEYHSLPDGNRKDWARIHLPEADRIADEEITISKGKEEHYLLGRAGLSGDSILDTFKDLEQKGITPEYIAKVGEIMAEVEGSFYDWRKETFKVPMDIEKEVQRAKDEFKKEYGSPAFQALLDKVEGMNTLNPNMSAEEINALTPVLLAYKKESAIFEQSTEAAAVRDRIATRAEAPSELRGRIADGIGLTSTIFQLINLLRLWRR